VYLAVIFQLRERLELNVTSYSFAINIGDMEAVFGYNRTAAKDFSSRQQIGHKYRKAEKDIRNG
jgi:hypothetical protein